MQAKNDAGLLPQPNTNGLEMSVLIAKLSEENIQVDLHDLPLGTSS